MFETNNNRKVGFAIVLGIFALLGVLAINHLTNEVLSTGRNHQVEDTLTLFSQK